MTRPPPLDETCALFLDVDGTLLDIAPRPELVRVPSELPSLLARLTDQRGGALALISGRSVNDVDVLFRPWRGAIAGLHGAERRHADGRLAVAADSPAAREAATAIERLRQPLAGLAQRLPGVWLEDKQRTLALHYRDAPAHGGEILHCAERLVRQSGGALRLIAGKMVVELQPLLYGKDGAIAAYMAEAPFHGRLPVFLGDDTTDEDGFAEVNRRGGHSVRVGGSKPGTLARYALPSVAAARTWLATGAGR
ncbi:MAG TPA: trehalose-phosphatase [Stellaceae bacterium]|nr:trehalose-phosphatase [Stellaceae bacterium]